MISVRYDCEAFLLQKYGGVSKYFSEIIEQFLEFEDLKIKPEFQFNRSSNFHLLETLRKFEIELKPAKKFINSKSGWSTLLTYGPLRSIMSAWSSGTKFNTEKCDILHATYYRPEFFERIGTTKTIVTVHDFIPEKLGWVGLRNPHIGKHALVTKADGIICVSQQTAEDLQHYYGIQDERVVVIHHGVNLPRISSNYKIENKNCRPYVLYVGHRSGYKNFSILVKAIKLLRKQHPEIELKVAGPSLSENEMYSLDQELGSLNWEGITEPITSKLQELYMNCLVFCSSSKYEGFGMTLLEAMACNAPVVASDIKIHREVAGEGALYFSPDSYEDLNLKLQVLLNDTVRYNLIKQGKNNAKKFTWSESALKHANFYNYICNI